MKLARLTIRSGIQSVKEVADLSFGSNTIEAERETTNAIAMKRNKHVVCRVLSCSVRADSFVKLYIATPARIVAANVKKIPLTVSRYSSIISIPQAVVRAKILAFGNLNAVSPPRMFASVCNESETIVCVPVNYNGP